MKQLRDFKEELNKSIPVGQMILSRSRAKGEGKELSDIVSDIGLIVVSDGFQDVRFRRRPIKLYDYWELHYPADFLCYTPEEFDEMKSRIGIVRQAVKEGLAI
ncbi:MAG: nucleotidyltransferase domain-containing protein [Candidatus Altiarchaeota archaeon]|nr:nucleotidyltransferase domain-containing protein [Candidatus Altiarchaeota archaeon]